MSVRGDARNALIRFVQVANAEECYLFTPDELCKIVDDESMSDEFFDMLFTVFALNKDFSYREVVNGLTNILMLPEKTSCR